MSFNSSFYRESSASASALLHVSTEVGESNAETAQKSNHGFCAAILALAQGAEPPRNGAYSPYVSTEVGESNAEIAQKSKQKQAAGYSLLYYYGSYSG